MLESKGFRSWTGILIFFCVGAYFCYLAYLDLHYVFLVHFDHSKNYDLVLWGPKDWFLFAMMVAPITMALIKKWWSTLPLWSLTLVILVFQICECLKEHDFTSFSDVFARIVLVPAAIQIAVLLRTTTGDASGIAI
jgi:hypothetical protein